MPSEPSPRRSATWSEAWDLSEPAYTELAFQAIFAVRQGNLAPSIPANQLATTARRRVRQSKFLVSVVLGILGFGTVLALNPLVTTHFGIIIPRGIFVGAVLAAVFVLELTMLWWTGLQVLPAYLSSGVVPLLASLPVDETTLRRVALLLLVRLFDAPSMACLVLTPLAVGIALGSWSAALLSLPGVIAAILCAIALALYTGRFFVRKVQGSRGGAARAVVRWTYLVLWAIPAFAMYGFLAIAPAFLRYLAALSLQGPAALLDSVFAAFPFPYAALPVYAAGLPTAGAGADLSPLPIAVGVAVYTLLLVLLVRWLLAAPLRLASESLQATGGGDAREVRLETGSLAGAVLRKDLRTASRTPGFAFLILLPLLDAAALGAWTFISFQNQTDVFDLAVAAVVSSALLATFFGPAFFAIEVMGYSYSRTLPLPERSVLGGKVALVALIYLLATGIVVSLTLARVFSPILFLGFVLAEFPAIVAGSILEISLLFRRARKTGLPIVNLFAGAWWAVVVSVPGLLVAGSPLVLFDALRATASSGWAVPAMAVVALSELGVCLPIAWLLGRRGAL